MEQALQKRLYDEMRSAFEELKATNEQLKKEIDTLGHTTAETREKEDKILDRLDTLETMMNRPVFTATEAKAKTEELVQRAYIMFLRRGADAMTVEQRDAWKEERAWATDDDTSAGYLVPMNVSDRMIERLIEFSPMRELANVETISVGNSLLIPTEGTGFASGWVGEREARPETATGTVGGEQIPTHEMYAKPKVTQWMLDDPVFDVEGWINRKVGESFGLLEGTAFFVGNGVGKPEGVLTRSGITAQEVNSGDANLLTPDGLINLSYALPEAYARNAILLARRLTIRDIRKFKDTTNNYLWQPGLALGAPNTILGYPYREAPDMPAIAAGAYAVAFGDWRAAYTIVDRQGIRVLRDPYSSKPFIEFYTTRRVGGQVTKLEAYRVQKVAA